MLKEFKAFALKGNLIEIAVGLILALAFSAVVGVFVAGVVMPLIAAIVGQPSFESIVWRVGDADILIGSLITQVVNFVLVAFVLFMIVKAASRAMPKKEEEPAGPTETDLLIQIRDSLASR